MPIRITNEIRLLTIQSFMQELEHEFVKMQDAMEKEWREMEANNTYPYTRQLMISFMNTLSNIEGCFVIQDDEVNEGMEELNA